MTPWTVCYLEAHEVLFLWGVCVYVCVCVVWCVCGVCVCVSPVLFDSGTPWTVCSLPGSSVHGISQARILELVAI